LSVLVVVLTVGAHQRDDRTKDAAVPGDKVMWVDPGDPSLFDFQHGRAGSEQEPRPPFSFVDQDLSRTTPKINVIDARGAWWNVKWGEEALPSVFCTRLASACGYLVEPEYFVASGRIDNARNLNRARRYVSDDGSFRNARFQLRADSPKNRAVAASCGSDNSEANAVEYRKRLQSITGGGSWLRKLAFSY